MRCKKHHTDLSSRVGVCATCLRERLLVVIASQTRLERAAAAAVTQDRRKHEQPPLIFPRSVLLTLIGGNLTMTVQGGSITDILQFSSGGSHHDNNRRFRCRLRGFQEETQGSQISESCNEPYSSSSSSSPSWFSAIFAAGRKKQQSSRTSRVEHFTQFDHRYPRSCADRGMSPATELNPGAECDRLPPEISPEVSPQWKRTPTTARRGRTGQGTNQEWRFA
ncbi:hypothetical protein F3Y22_tig00110621pilonHSYRG00360 [Hibiscus syriacus]|uniref:Uncharacterized protein n=1 Tax=Hibiscus syriacus TaxID=106335 RepID=A0A6A2ZZM7_HIBSY|nr:hypothetical protein F3Y22_tig00110621pilonHSYRG00360 [Hibiscus syriacus]